jgi:transposase
MDTAIAGASMLNPFLPPKQLQARLGLFDISDDTVARRLDEAGLHARVARREFHLSQDHRDDRLKFARGYQRWTEDDWCTVVFADEKLFWGEGHSGRVFVRRPDDSANDEQYWVQKKPHPVSVPAWACFTAQGPGYMAMYEGSATGTQMGAIYRDYLIPTVREHFGVGRGARWIVHDNDSRHRSPSVKQVLHSNSITPLDFPPYSPDLNPIENLWTDVQNRMEGKPVSTKEEIEAALQEAWGETKPEYCNKLARSMPRRIAQCIEREGAYTDY